MIHVPIGNCMIFLSFGGLNVCVHIGFTSLCEKYSTMGQSGVDQLTTTLNTYLSALVEGILGSDGDILKFAGFMIIYKYDLTTHFIHCSLTCTAMVLNFHGFIYYFTVYLQENLDPT